MPSEPVRDRLEVGETERLKQGTRVRRRPLVELHEPEVGSDDLAQRVQTGPRLREVDDCVGELLRVGASSAENSDSKPSSIAPGICPLRPSPRPGRGRAARGGSRSGSSGRALAHRLAPRLIHELALPSAEERVCQRETGIALELIPRIEKRECSTEQRRVLHEVRHLHLLLHRLCLAPERVH
jgi:hypothetical protein